VEDGIEDGPAAGLVRRAGWLWTQGQTMEAIESRAHYRGVEWGRRGGGRLEDWLGCQLVGLG